MNEEINKSNSNNKILITLVIILFILVLCLGGYLVYDKVINTNENNDIQQNNDKQNIEEELDISSLQVQSLFAPFNYYLDASEEELYSKDKITPSDLSIEYKNRLAFAKYWSENKKYEDEQKVEEYISLGTITSTTLETYYKKLFGSNENYVAKSFSSYDVASLSMTYDSQKNIYIASQNGGDSATFRYGNELYKAIKKGNTIELYEYVVVFNSNWNNNLAGVYKNANDAANFKNAIKEVKSVDNSTFDELGLMKYYDYEGVLDDLSEYKESASQYKLIFTNENGNYVFTSIEKIK